MSVGLMVALLLLALSHQLSALVQLSASEAGVQLLDGYHGSSYAAAAHVGDEGSGRKSPFGGAGSRPASRLRCVVF